MATARDLAGDNYQVVSIIGDGAITGGMALEALNHTGHLGRRLIVILNDNGMSISPTVGAFSKILGKIRFNRRYYRASEESKKMLSTLPLGDKIWQMGQHVKSGVKGLLMPTVIWEEFGFAYMGPFDGHNIAEMEDAFAKARDYSHKPTLIHVITAKGHGYPPAEDNAVYFHGVSPKMPPKANGRKKVPTYSEVFSSTTLNLMRKNKKIVVVTPAMPEGNCLAEVQKEFPDRVFDVGICEQHAVTFAAGLATQGYIPIVAIYSTFLQRAYDQIVHDVCLQKLPVVFAIDRGGIVGDDGKTHQGTLDISYLTPIPNIVVSAPKDENELQHLLYTAAKLGRPMSIRYPRSCGLGVPMDEKLKAIPVGKAELLRNGDDVAILAIGTTVAPALAAASMLEERGVQAAVVNGRFAKPLDEGLIIELAGRCGRLVTVEESAIVGSFGSAVDLLLQQHGIEIPVKNIAIPDEFVEHGSQARLRAKYHLDDQGIMDEVLALVAEDSGSLKTASGRI
jgi:1-deoxy-D-xylulose-5-phosphate synthase